MIKKSLIALLPLAILVGGWYFVQVKKTNPVNAETTNFQQNNSTKTSDVPTDANNPLASIKEDAPDISGTSSSDSPGISSTQANANQTNTDQAERLSTNSVAAPSTDSIDAASIAIEPLSDAEFIRLEQQIKNDAQLRLNLLEEFRYNTDPVRAQQLAALLGPYDDPQIFQVASELAYSGDPQSRIAGLELLRRIQPRNNEARDIAIDLLNSGDDTKMLVATMNVLATPSRNVTDSQLQSLNDNLSNLSNHYDSTVRAQSLSLFGRWDQNSNTAREAFSRGLTDTDPAVRSSATFAINNISNPDAAMVSGLLNIAENADEDRSTRYAALRALEKMPLSGTQMRRYEIAKRSANRR